MVSLRVFKPAMFFLLAFTQCLALTRAHTKYTSQSDVALRAQKYDVRRGVSDASINSTHDYYTMAVYDTVPANFKWMEADSTWKSFVGAERSFITLDLSFSFPFYGIKTRGISIATGGFVSPSDDFVSVQSHYLAPLLADFESMDGASETVRYKDFGMHFVVQWEDVVLRSNQTHLPFAFQVYMDSTGTIAFTYKELPLPVNEIAAASATETEPAHPVEVGLADAYSRLYDIDGEQTLVHYHYHSIDVPRDQLEVGGGVVFKALKSCSSFTTCGDCLSQETAFDCGWCSALEVCSDGVDRNRDEIVKNGCELAQNRPATVAECPVLTYLHYTFEFEWPSTEFHETCWYWLAVRIDKDESALEDREVTPIGESSNSLVSFSIELSVIQHDEVLEQLSSSVPLNCNGESGDLSSIVSTKRRGALSTEALIVIVSAAVFLLLLFGVIGLLVYAHYRPRSASGQWLLKHRKCHGICCCTSERYAHQHDQESNVSGNGTGNDVFIEGFDEAAHPPSKPASAWSAVQYETTAVDSEVRASADAMPGSPKLTAARLRQPLAPTSQLTDQEMSMAVNDADDGDLEGVDTDGDEEDYVTTTDDEPDEVDV
eukprot:m.260344 g.260344  ORF g.260344 m.260344 type:complete len:601 (+) comp15558_c0_seq3:179-1981(+)